MAPKRNQTGRKATATASKRGKSKPSTKTRPQGGVSKKPAARPTTDPRARTRGAVKAAGQAPAAATDEEREDDQDDAEAGGEKAEEEAGPPTKSARTTGSRKRKAADDNGEDEDAVRPSTRRPPSMRTMTNKGKGRAPDPPEKKGDEDSNDDEDQVDADADPPDTAGTAVVDDKALMDEEHSYWSGLNVIATSKGRQKCTYKGSDARLIVYLKVHPDPDSISRLGYSARFLLQRGDAYEADNEDASDLIGSIQSWRIAKATGRFPDAENAAWLEEILSPRKKDLLIVETAKCLQVLFTREGSVKKVVRDYANELEQSSLMFIQMIHIREAFARNGLLRHALDAWYAALRCLPEWFAFSGTLVLVPAKPEGPEGDSWGAMDDLNIENALIEVYRKYGFEVWVMGKLKGDHIPVMGRMTPGEVPVDQEGGDGQSEN